MDLIAENPNLTIFPIAKELNVNRQTLDQHHLAQQEKQDGFRPRIKSGVTFLRRNDGVFSTTWFK